MTSGISFQGLSTNLQTDKLVDAALYQSQSAIDRMQAKQDQNKLRASLIRTMRTNLQSLNTTLSSISSTAFQNRSVTSSDPNASQVSATASGAASGAYDVVVSDIATKARLTSSVALGSSDASLGGAVNPETGTYDYAITDKNGKQTTISLTAEKNTLAGLRDAINASSSNSGVNATIVQGTVGQYKLVMTANETGLGTSGSATDSISLRGNAGNLLQLSSEGSGTVGAEKAVNAKISVNGMLMERASNVITDAVEGVTFTLKSKDPAKTTTLTVAVDKVGITSALNDVVAKYNALYKVYKDNSGQGGALAGDSTIRGLMAQTHSALMGVPGGLSSSNPFQTAASLGLKTGRDGTMSLDTTALQSALDSDIGGAGTLFENLSGAFRTFADSAAGYGSGSISGILTSIEEQNLRLNRQISTSESRMEKQRESLQRQYSALEATVGHLQSMGQSLGGLR